MKIAFCSQVHVYRQTQGNTFNTIKILRLEIRLILCVSAHKRTCLAKLHQRGEHIDALITLTGCATHANHTLILIIDVASSVVEAMLMAADESVLSHASPLRSLITWIYSS